jgi:F0F1-type ATP synthase assembly protein I
MAKRPGSPVTTVQALAVASQFGITLAVAVVLGFFAGQWLDSKLNTGIIFSLIGVLIGLVGSAVNTVRLYRNLLRRNEPDANVETTESTRPADDDNPNG